MFMGDTYSVDFRRVLAEGQNFFATKFFTDNTVRQYAVLNLM